MHILLAITLLLPQAMEIQTDWVSGPGTLGPLGTWGSAFYQSESINYNISGQISLVGTTIPGGWVKHTIQTYSGIRGQDGTYPADFDGDGDLDLAAWISNSDLIRIYKNQKVETGDVNFVFLKDLSLPGNTGYGLLWCGDFDNDGDADIVVPRSPGWVWFENTGSFNFTSHTIGSTNYGRASCDVGDVDNDGDKDILIYGDTGTKLDLWRNDGTMTFTRVVINTTGNWWRVNLGDLNNDNYLDIFNSGDVYINSGGNFSSTPSWTAPNTGDIDGISIRDFNNDGKKDLLIAFEFASTPEIAWYENNGSGTSYTKHSIVTGTNAYNYGDACIGEDMDLDGIADVLGAYTRVGYFRQAPLNTFTLVPIDNNFDEAHWIFASNLDYRPGGSDFDLDILGTGQGQFAWWENITAGVRFASFGYLESPILEKLDATSWQKLYWVGSHPETTMFRFYVRSGTDAASIVTNPWQGPFNVPVGPGSGNFDISGVTTPGHHYFQYRVEMGGGSASPVLYEAAVEYGVPAGLNHDVGVIAILEPNGEITPDSTVIPTALVKNFGGFDEDFLVFFTIGCIYFDVRFIHLGAGQTTTVAFNPWVSVLGLYNEGAATYLDVDENPNNNAVTAWLLVKAGAIVNTQPFAIGPTPPCGYDVPITFDLFKPYPNPTANNLSISFALPNPSNVEIAIYDINGRVVKNLLSGSRAAGTYRLNTDCRELRNGIYITKMTAGNFKAIEKFVVSK